MKETTSIKDTLLFFAIMDDKTIHIKKNNNYLDFVKIQYNPTIDLFFMKRNQFNKINMNDVFEYCCFYDKKSNDLYGLSSNLQKLIPEYNTNEKGVSFLLDEISDNINSILVDYVLDNKEEFYAVANDYSSEIKKEDLYQYIIDGEKEKKLNFHYSCEDENFILSYFTEGEQALYDEAYDYIESNREYIGKILIDCEKINLLLSQINSDKKNYIHKRKAIIDSLKKKEYGFVKVFIDKDGKESSFNYDSYILKTQWNRKELYIANMPIADKIEFEMKFGPESTFTYENIYKISYHNKILYEDKKFKYSKDQLTQEEELSL